MSPSLKKAKPNPTSEKVNEDCVITHTQAPAAAPAVTPLRINSIDAHWQQSACQELGLQHTAQPRPRPGGGGGGGGLGHCPPHTSRYAQCQAHVWRW